MNFCVLIRMLLRLYIVNFVDEKVRYWFYYKLLLEILVFWSLWVIYFLIEVFN